MTLLSFVVILFLWERGQDEGFAGYYLKDMLIWEEGFCLCVFGKGDEGVYTFQSSMDQI